MILFGKPSTVPAGFDSAVSFATDRERAMLPQLGRKSPTELRLSMQLLIEDRYGRQIRRVIGFEEKTKDGGGCSTCSFDYIEVDIYFKDWGGRILKLEYGGSLPELVVSLSRKLGKVL